MYSVVRCLETADSHLFVEYLALDEKNGIYWTRFGPGITCFNDKDLAQMVADNLNKDFECEVCTVSLGLDACDG